MTVLQTRRLTLRNWEERDRPLFHRINSDDEVMRFFHFRRDRAASDAVMDLMRADIEAQGYGWTAAELRDGGACIGFVGLRPAEVPGITKPGAHEIGWRLAPEFWGHGYVTEAASALLDFAFGRLGLDEVVSYAVETNTRSTGVMKRLGMEYQLSFDHPSVPDTHPELKRHALHATTKSQRPLQPEYSARRPA